MRRKQPFIQEDDFDESPMVELANKFVAIANCADIFIFLNINLTDLEIRFCVSEPTYQVFAATNDWAWFFRQLRMTIVVDWTVVSV